MSILIQVKNRTTKEIVRQADDARGRLAYALAHINRDNYPYLRYIDAYGDTIFNWAQMERVIPELESILGGARNEDERSFFRELLEMAVCCRDGVDLYLLFIGD